MFCLSLSSLQLTTVREDSFLEVSKTGMNMKYRAWRKKVSQAKQRLTLSCLNNAATRKIFPFHIACPENLLGSGQRIKIVVKNSVVMARESKVDGSTAAVGILSTSVCIQGWGDPRGQAVETWKRGSVLVVDGTSYCVQ